MKATLFPGRYLIVTGIPAIDLQIGSLLFNTEDDAKQGIKDLHLNIDSIKPCIRKVDVSICTADSEQPKA